MSDAVRLEPCDGGVRGLCLLSLDELEAANAQRRFLAVITSETLLRKSRCRIGVVVCGVVARTEPQLALRCHESDGVVWRGQYGRLGYFLPPVPAMQPLRHSDAQQRFDIAIRVVVRRSFEPLPGVHSSTVVYRHVKSRTWRPFTY